MKLLLALLLLAALPCLADDLPSKPERAPHTRWEMIPAREVKHTFSDMVHFRTIDDGVIEWSYLGAYTADMVTSAQVGQRFPRTTEVGTLCYGTHGVKCIIPVYAGVAVLRLVASHILTKHMNHWYTDMLAGYIVGAGLHGHAQAAWDNSRQ